MGAGSMAGGVGRGIWRLRLVSFWGGGFFLLCSFRVLVPWFWLLVVKWLTIEWYLALGGA